MRIMAADLSSSACGFVIFDGGEPVIRRKYVFDGKRSFEANLVLLFEFASSIAGEFEPDVYVWELASVSWNMNTNRKLMQVEGVYILLAGCYHRAAVGIRVKTARRIAIPEEASGNWPKERAQEWAFKTFGFLDGASEDEVDAFIVGLATPEYLAENPAELARVQNLMDTEEAA